MSLTHKHAHAHLARTQKITDALKHTSDITNLISKRAKVQTREGTHLHAVTSTQTCTRDVRDPDALLDVMTEG